MAGRTVHYPGSLSMNVLDVCGLQCSSFGRWDDASADTVSICNAGGRIYRSLHWTDDRLTGTSSSDDLTTWVCSPTWAW